LEEAKEVRRQLETGSNEQMKRITKKAQMVGVRWPDKVASGAPQCPRCKSVRVQHGYKDTPILFRLVRRYELLCNNCGLEFQEFALWDGVSRKPSTIRQSEVNKRRAPRYQVHLPVTISLADRAPSGDRLIFSKASLGHCEVISKVGMALSFVGSRFSKQDFIHTGRLLFVDLTLPNGGVDALITTVTHQGVDRKRGRPFWFIGATITHLAESDTALLAAYLDEMAKRVPVLLQE
jgi:hypothetical protein